MQYRKPILKSSNPDTKKLTVHGGKQRSFNFIQEQNILDEIIGFTKDGLPITKGKEKIYVHKKLEGNAAKCRKRRTNAYILYGVQMSVHRWILHKARQLLPFLEGYEVHHHNENCNDNTLPHYDKNGKFHIGNVFLMKHGLHMRHHMLKAHYEQKMLGMEKRSGLYSKQEKRDWEYRLCGETPPSELSEKTTTRQLKLLG